MNEVNREITRAVKRLVWSTVALFFATLALASFVYVDGGNKQDALHHQQKTLAAQQANLRQQQADSREQQRALLALAVTQNKSLCNFRGYLKHTVAVSKRYLSETPHAIPGITPAMIRRSIRTQESYVAQFGNLHCGRRAKGHAKG